VRTKGPLKLQVYKAELLDIAVGAIFGYICINGGYIE